MDEREWNETRDKLESLKSVSNLKKVAVWLALDCPVSAPSAYKQELVKNYALAYNIDTLIETGTYMGDMVQACKDTFVSIHSIELSKDLYKNARERFKNNKNIHLYHGDSGGKLSSILKKLKKPAIFWLDAHYSEGITAKGELNTPIIKEVEAILLHKIKRHIILIDDSRIFIGENDYPTVSDLEKKFLKVLPTANFVDRHDIIRVQPDDKYIDI